MVMLKAFDDQIACALEHVVQSTGGPAWITAADLLRLCPDIRAHHTRVTHSLQRMMELPSITDHSISVTASAVQQDADHNFKRIYLITPKNPEIQS